MPGMWGGLGESEVNDVGVLMRKVTYNRVEKFIGVLGLPDPCGTNSSPRSPCRLMLTIDQRCIQ